MTTSYAGPTASMYLADLGAAVVKVERPGAGDDARGWGPPFVAGDSAWFASANRNKRSVVLDLQSELGRTALLRLLDTADVFMQNMNPAKLAAMGIDAPSLLERNPRLIYCGMSGFGADGPDSDRPGYDLIAQARSGIMSVTGEKDRAPQRVSTALSDVVTGMCAVIAINAAAVRQATTGEGDVIDVSLLDTDLALMAPRIAAFHAGDLEPAPSGGMDSVLSVYQPFDAADRTLVVAIGNDSIWRRFCAALDLHDLSAEAALADNAGRRLHRERISGQIAARLAERPAAHWLEVLGAAAVPVSPVHSLSEVVNDPQVRARGALLPVPGSDGQLVSVHTPFRLASIGAPRNERFPKVGTHTEAVLLELGFTHNEVEQIVRAGMPPGGRAATLPASEVNA